MPKTISRDGDVTLLLEQLRMGDAHARDRLTRLIYDELRKLAHSKMRKEQAGHVLDATALAHEAIVRLLESNALGLAPNRRYLFAAASKSMRNILVDHGRKRRRERRAGIDDFSALDEILTQIEGQGAPILELNEALNELEQVHPRQSQVVEMRFFGGFSVKETADALNISISTVESDFRIARAWLRVKLQHTT
jgi:RNA polymerase sigma-70 factor (ECF subfamily)